jgi:hypothetical protein
MAKFKVGDKVRVPWNLDYVEGVVRELQGPPGMPFVLVAIMLPQDEEAEGTEEHTVSLPADALEPVG